MARINLLPWREQLREERKQRFLVAMAGVLVTGIGAILLAGQYIGSAIDRQTARNDYVQKEIGVLDGRIKQISELKMRRKQLFERMRVIQDLQGNRPVIGRVFDQMARTLPDGVYFTSVKMDGKTVSVAGAAETNNRVSELMRNLDASPWLEAPSLNEVKAATGGDTPQVGQTNVFQLTVRQSRPPVEGAAP
ncbi:PilN domain-containing protein [Pseudomonas sp. R5(2019)]|uniref:PilN domain-containing protein n=1 Tax=Pseudomonas sp. R5(2019) TaxID=2697566 RepID=UPI0014131B05|nr:PilN domain-containing protein [Pseudomonas sp. R5(2019)]NBA94025.1 pilus assembly protein PilN [Pseudomonas sp. R5(2019)]